MAHYMYRMSYGILSELIKSSDWKTMFDKKNRLFSKFVSNLQFLIARIFKFWQFFYFVLLIKLLKITKYYAWTANESICGIFASQTIAR